MTMDLRSSSVDSNSSAAAWTVQSLANGTLAAGPAAILHDHAKARGVNDAATICGWDFTTSAGDSTPGDATVWSGGTSQSLDLAKFVLAAYSYDVSNKGVILGSGAYWRNFEQGRRAVVWPSAGGSMVLLDSFLPRQSPFAWLDHANAVNDSGWIVGTDRGDGSTGFDGSFLAIPK